MTKIHSSILAITMAFALSGCQGVFGDSAFASRTAQADPATVDMSEYFVQRLEAGKAHLRNSRPTQAIAAFRQASYDPARAGDAYNGMGVAYAQIGRADLAKRYFGMAVAAAPQDERFARNLARLDGQAAADAIQLAASTADAVAMAEQAAASPVEVSSPAPLVRVSDREVRIVARKSAEAEAPTAPTVDEGVVLAARDNPVRVESRGARLAANTGYPVRIALADVKSTAAPYPIRIELPKAR